MPHSYGLRARTRHLFRREFRKKGQISLSTYLRTYRIGQHVDIRVNGSIQKGMPHKYYHGRTGTIFNVTQTSVGVLVKKRVGNRYIPKRLYVRIEHVRPSKCRDDFIRRVQEYRQLRQQARASGEYIRLKRQPAGPRSAHLITGDSLIETVRPLPCGGMIATLCTSPLDIIRTRLQSQQHYPFARPIQYIHRLTLSNTLRQLIDIYRDEGSRSLFRGLGPNLIGVVPSKAIHFYTYGNTKTFLSTYFNNSDSSWIHLTAAICAGIVTSTATNPIWVIKTRLQLDKTPIKMYHNAWDCLHKIIQQEGIRSLYRGMSASYLGISESTIQWVLYERFKKRITENQTYHSPKYNAQFHLSSTWAHHLAAAGTAKLIATLLTYPHEVVRTRLRQFPIQNGVIKYKGLIQCFCLIWKEEGFYALYGGLTAHLLRVIPNAAIMFGSYELIMNFFSE
ncbi:hypothetical protein PCK1_000835 [Pneumocystis canis]|nr:hypothetical protein PCK1_000835 [Pneumocystis canis]